MTNEEMADLTMFGVMLAYLCLHGNSTDQNKSFYKAVKHLSNNDKEKLLREVIYLRFSIVMAKLVRDVTNKEKLDLITKQLFDSVRKELNQENDKILFNKMLDYNIVIDDNTPRILINNAGIQRMNDSDIFSFYYEYFPVRLTEFSMVIKDNFDYFLSPPNERDKILKNIDKRDSSLEKLYKPKKKTGCLSVITIMFLVIIGLICF